MKKELNNFQVIVTDLSGNGVSGYEDFITAEIVVGGVAQTTTVTEITGRNIDGYYNIAVDFTATGSGNATYSIPSSANYNISPDAENFVVDARDVDDIYSLVLASNQSTREVNLGGDYSRFTITHKYNTDFNRDYTILVSEAGTATLSGWSNFGLSFYTSDAFTDCPSAADEFLYKDAAVSVVDADSMVVNVSGGLLAPTIPCGQNFTTIYADLVGTDPSGNIKVLKENVIKVVRKF